MTKETSIKLFEEKKVRTIRNETVTNCNQLKLLAENGKMRLTNVASTEQIFRIIQSKGSELSEKIGQLKLQSFGGKKYLVGKNQKLKE